MVMLLADQQTCWSTAVGLFYYMTGAGSRGIVDMGLHHADEGLYVGVFMI